MSQAEYHVWVTIEEERLDAGEDNPYDDIGLPDKLATFDTYEEAAEFVRDLPGWAQQGDTSDYRLHPGLCSTCGARLSDCLAQGCYPK